MVFYKTTEYFLRGRQYEIKENLRKNKEKQIFSNYPRALVKELVLSGKPVRDTKEINLKDCVSGFTGFKPAAQGYRRVVDIGLGKHFDTVNHDLLIGMI